MAKVFYISEVITFAIEREKESCGMYKELSETVQEQVAKDLFVQLMNEEEKHRVTYADLLSQVDPQRSPGVPTDTAEYEEYMKYLIAEHRTLSAPPAISPDNIGAIIDYAIDREKDAVLFYTGLEGFVADKDKATIKSIIKEEGSHIVKLSLIKKEMS